MTGLRYAHEKLGAGTQLLATHPGDIRNRLIAAFHASLYAVPTEVLPAELKEMWKTVWRTVTSVPGATDAGFFGASINALTDDEAVAVATMITTVDSIVDRLSVEMV